MYKNITGDWPHCNNGIELLNLEDLELEDLELAQYSDQLVYEEFVRGDLLEQEKYVLKNEALALIRKEISRLCLLLLTPKEERVWRMIHEHGNLRNDIASTLNVSHQRISQIILKAERRLSSVIYHGGEIYLAKDLVQNVLSIHNRDMKNVWGNIKDAAGNDCIIVEVRDFNAEQRITKSLGINNLKKETQEALMKQVEFVHIDYIEAIRSAVAKLEITVLKFFQRNQKEKFSNETPTIKKQRTTNNKSSIRMQRRRDAWIDEIEEAIKKKENKEEVLCRELEGVSISAMKNIIKSLKKDGYPLVIKNLVSKKYVAQPFNSKKKKNRDKWGKSFSIPQSRVDSKIKTQSKLKPVEPKKNNAQLDLEKWNNLGRKNI